MMVVTIIGILATIAIPKITGAIRKANEGATIGRLLSIRSAIGIYSAEYGGVFPSNVSVLTLNNKYLKEIQSTKLSPYHQNNSAVLDLATTSGFDDASGYAYVNVATDPNFGTLFINCTHTDTKGSVWTTY